MKTLTTILIACTLLAGCKKDEAAKPAAAPDLVGTWTQDHLHTVVKDAAGTVTYDGNSTNNNMQLILTADHYTERSSTDGRVFVDGTYTRNGNTLQASFPTPDSTYTQTFVITELTEHQLVLSSDKSGSSGGSTRTEGHYTR